MRLAFVILTYCLTMFSLAAHAAEEFVEGKDYITLPEPVAPADSSTIEVNEMFSYACPHCKDFEPLISAWAAKQSADVKLVQTHASFVSSWPIYQRGYYTVLALGVKDKVHAAVFDAVHVAHKELTSAQAWADFLSIYGVDKQKTLSTFNSFGVNSQMKQADAKIREFKVSSTPQIFVDGRYRVAVKTHEDMLKVASFLVAKVRAERAAKKH